MPRATFIGLARRTKKIFSDFLKRCHEHDFSDHNSFTDFVIARRIS